MIDFSSDGFLLLQSLQAETGRSNWLAFKGIKNSISSIRTILIWSKAQGQINHKQDKTQFLEAIMTKWGIDKKMNLHLRKRDQWNIKGNFFFAP